MEGLWLPIAAPLLGFGLAFGGRHAYDTLLKLRERRRLRASFAGSVSPTVMQEILAGRISPELGGTRETVCVMFSDIRGFTTRSERMTPEQTIQFLNRYFETVVSLIHQHDGCVASFIGDGIMAVFGAPKPLANPCAEAFAAARAMLGVVADLNRQFVAEGTATMDIGIGLQVGEAVMGHVGSRTRHDFTAIGDVTNVASRLESLTKEAGYRIVVSKTVAEQLGADAGLTPLGEMGIKGHTPVDVYGYEKI
jgi:adenylate cyclase